MRFYVHLGYLVVIITRTIFGKEEVVKCLTTRTERIKLSCPKGLVLYSPSIIAGVSAHAQGCKREENDCTGVPLALEKHVQSCYWRSSCEVTFRRDYTLKCDGVDRNITYVVFGNMYCVSKDNIFDICSKKQWGKIDLPVGVIKSHRTYPREKPRARCICEMTIPVKHTNTLILQIFPFDKKLPLGLKVEEVQRGTLLITRISKIVDAKTMVYGNETKAIKVTADFRWKRKQISGFMLSFIAYKTTQLNQFLEIPNAMLPVLKELSSVFEVRPVIEQCASVGNGRMELSCSENEVIYSPAIYGSSYSRSLEKCIFGHYPCGGLTPSLIVQRNSCFWKEHCHVTWAAGEKLLLSKETRCIGYTMSAVGTTGHRCVHRGNIYDLCMNGTETVDAAWGILRSHPTYPWFLPSHTSHTDYKTIIKIGSKRALQLTIQDINLDPDGRDKFKIYHKTRRGGQRVLLESRQKQGQEGEVINAREGKLIIKLRLQGGSKSGRGIVLVFRRFPLSKRDTPDVPYAYGSSSAAGIVNDAESAPMRHFTNRMLCSGGKNLRRQGRSCAPRVWTDYFTKLE